THSPWCRFTRHLYHHGVSLLSPEPSRRICSTNATHLQQHPSPSWTDLLSSSTSCSFCHQHQPRTLHLPSCRIARSLWFFPSREDLAKA
ncbi:hypothetical protein JI435_403790, partial [Parastagonospora nodorum SN15]